MSTGRWWHTCILLLLCCCSLAQAENGDDWPAMADQDLVVKPGSVLDFSSFQSLNPITDADRIVIDAQGQFRVARSGQPRRFLIAALGFNIISGGLPKEGDSAIWVDQVVRRGYNMVRLDFVEDMLMHKRAKDFDVDPVQLRRLHHLLARLRQAGVYYILNLLSSNNGAYGSIAERWRHEKQLVSRMYHDPEAVAHWKRLVQTIYGRTNPVTGQSILQDPALAGVALVNESGMAFLTRQATQPAIENQWRKWLDAQPKIAGHSDWVPFKRNDAAWQAFMLDSESRLARELTQFMREQGFQGAVTMYNNWLSPAASLSRASLPWIDMHHYAAEPDQWVSPGSTLRSVDTIGWKGGYLRDLAATRVWNKPFTVSEYGQVFWDPQRHAHALLAPSVAALQGWQGICQHSRAIELEVASQGGLKQLRPFMAGMDPISRANEVIAAAAFGRGDVRSSSRRTELLLSRKHATEEMPPLSAVNKDWAQLSLVTAIGLRPEGQPVPNGSPGADLSIKLSSRPESSPRDLTEAIAVLRKQGVLAKDNLTNVAANVFQSDTGELLLDARAGQFKVQSPRLEGMSFRRGTPPALRHLEVLHASSGATVALISVDGSPIDTSLRMLLVVATDARNTGMRFRDARDEVLEQIGTWPIRLKPIQLKLRLALGGNDWMLYPVALNGQRHAPVPIQRDAMGLNVDIDTQKLRPGPSVYFELIRRN